MIKTLSARGITVTHVDLDYLDIIGNIIEDKFSMRMPATAIVNRALSLMIRHLSSVGSLACEHDEDGNELSHEDIIHRTLSKQDDEIQALYDEQDKL